MAKRRQTQKRRSRNVKVMLVTQADGTIVGGMLAVRPRRGEPRVQFQPLPGQSVHEVDVPEDLMKTTNAQELHAALSCYRVTSGQSRLVRCVEEIRSRD